MVESLRRIAMPESTRGNECRVPVPNQSLFLSLVLVVGFLGFGQLAFSGQGYQPYRGRQNIEERQDSSSEEGRTRLETPPRQYLPYRRRPVETQSEEEQPRIDSRPQVESRQDRDDVEDQPVTSRQASWQAVPARPNRRPTRLAPQYQPDQDAEATASLVADDGGPIAELLLHYAVNSEGELGTIYRDLFQHLGQNVRLQICCPNDASVEAFSNRWGAAAVGEGRQVQVVNVNRPITVWARDRRICRQTPDGRPAASFVPTAHFTYDPEKQNDLVLSSLMYPTGLVPAVSLASFHLEGGNCVSNRRHVFVGANAFDDNANRFVSESAMFAELSKIFGRPTVPIQGTDGETPWIHTDMYLTPVDTRTILVASPAAGCRLLEGQDAIVVPHRDRQTTVNFDVLGADSERQVRFDNAAQQLADMGYQVIRVPALMNAEKDWMVTYNNVLMDYQDGQRIVYMPIYHIPELDHAAAQIYRNLGFEVRAIDVSPIFQLGGAIRCLANVTRRLPYSTRLQHQESAVQGRLQVFSVDPTANRVREPRPRFERRPLPPSLRERPQASIQRPADVAH